MAIAPMYPGKENSPETSLVSGITSDATSVQVANTSALPTAPNYMVVGRSDAEIVFYPDPPSNGVYSGVTRGVGGTTARAWPDGTSVARRFCAIDLTTVQENIEDLDDRIGAANPTALDDLTDTTITDPTEDQFLRYNGTAWVNETIPMNGLAQVDHTLNQDATIAPNTCYWIYSDGLRTFTLPTVESTSDGVVVRLVMVNEESGAYFKIAQREYQRIVFGTLVTAVGTSGSITSTEKFCELTLIASSFSSQWYVLDARGSFDVVTSSGTVRVVGTAQRFNDLPEVSISSPTEDQFLRYNGTAWANETVSTLDGEDGLSVLSGSGAPASELGVDGEFYINTSTHDIYGPKTAGAWGSPTSLIGPQGETGATGPAGADGDDGVGHDAVSALISRAGGWTHPTVSQGTAFSADALTASARARYRYKEALARRDRMTTELAAWAIPARLDLISGTEGTDWFDATDNAYHEIVASAGSQSATLTSLIEDLPENAVLYIPAGSYRFDTTVNFSKPIIIVGEAGTVIDCTNATADADLFTVNVGGSASAKMSGVELFGLEFVGPGYDTDPRLMRAFYLQGLRVQFCYFHGFGQSVIRLHGCDDTLIEYNRFDNNSYAGVGYSVSIEDRSDRTTVRHNWFTTRGRHFITTATDLGSYTPADYVGEILVEDNYFQYHIDYRLDTGASAVDTHDNCNGPVVIRRNVFENVNKMVQLRSCTRGAVVVDNVGINCYLGIYTTNEDLSTTPWHTKVDIIADNFIDIDGDYALVVDQGNADISRNIIRCGYAYYHADLGTHTADYLALTDTIWGWGEYASDPGELLKPGSDATETGSVQLIEAEMSEPDEIDPFTSSGGAAVDSWLDAGAFTRASDATFTVTDNATNQAIFVAGRPLRYRATAGTWRYGIVTGYASGTVTLAGHALTTSDDDEMAYGDMARVVQVPVLIPGYYEDATETALIAADLGSQLTWGQGTAYLVRVRARSRVHDTGTDGTINVSVNGQNVLSTALTLAADATWVSSTTGIAASYYDAQFDEVIEVVATKNGNGDAQDLAVQMTFVVA